MVKRLRDSTGHSGRASRKRCSPRISLKGENDMFRRIDVCLALLAGLGLGLTVFAKAQDACTASGIAGTYVVTCNGYISAAANAPLLPATLLASANAAKNGQWSGTGTLSLGGSIVTQDVKSVGPAQVNPDCTGSITYSQTIDGQPAPRTVVMRDTAPIHRLRQRIARLLAFLGAIISSYPLEGFSNLVVSRREGLGLAQISNGANPWTGSGQTLEHVADFGIWATRGHARLPKSGSSSTVRIGPSVGGPGHGLCALLTGLSTAPNN